MFAPKRRRCGRMTLLVALACVARVDSARADVALSPLGTWEGAVGYYLIGAPLAIDTDADGDQNVDTLMPTVSMAVSAADVPAGASLLGAYLYWGGTQRHLGNADSSVGLTLPGGTRTDVLADVSYMSDGESASYDMFVSRANVTSLVAAGGTLTGEYLIDGYSGRIGNDSTDNASAALLLIFNEPAVPRRRVMAHDGLMTLVHDTQLVTLSGFEAGPSAGSSLAYYSLEGDTGGAGTEQVRVTGRPGGSTVTLSDADNPTNNPMNGTINTSRPPQTGTTGIDIDRFAISSAVTAGDTSLEVAYQAVSDKWWLALNVVSVTLPPSCSACDLDADGVISTADQALFMTFYGSQSAGGSLTGDLDGNGRVGLSDLARLRSFFGEQVGSPAAVPEPATGALIAAVMAGVAWFRYRGRSRKCVSRRGTRD